MNRTLSFSLATLLAAGCGGSTDDRGARTDDTGVDVAVDADVEVGDVDEDRGPDVVADADVGPDPDAEADTDADADNGPPTCDPSSGTAASFGVGAWTIAVAEDGSWTVTPPDAELPTLLAPPTCADDGRARVRVAGGMPHVLNEFGAFRITLEDRTSDLIWAGVAGPPQVDGTALVYDVIGGGSVTMRFSENGGDLRVALEGAWNAGEIAWSLGADESFFGLGSQVTGMDLRGRTYPLWTQEQGNGKPEGTVIWPLQGEPEAAYAPMGVWHSSDGYSAVITHDAYSELDIGKSFDDEVALRSYPELPGFVLVTGSTPRERLRSITEYTGRLPFEPAPWTFAPWNDAVGGPDRLREVAAALRDNDVPSSAIWSEDWIGGEETATGYRLSYAWEWSEDTYPDLPDDIEWLHGEGFAFLAYFNTFVPEPTRMWDEGVEGGFLMQTDDGEPRTVTDPAFRTAGLVDLTNADATEWFRSYMVTAAEMGIDGWMADFTEWAPVDAALADGSDPWLFHNRYPLRFQETVSDALQSVHDGADDEPTNNWTYFARSGWASVNGGTGGIAPTLWGGDQNTNWDYDDGYPTVVPIATHLGLSGVPIFGSDVAGYNALFMTPTTKELFYRWSAMAAFHGLMRTHHGSSECANWAFDRDAETLSHYRRYAVIHTLMYPLFRELALDAMESGLPLVRHPFLVAPGADWMWRGDGFQFFLGDDILVAPVLEEGGTTRDVAVPQSGWWPIFGSAPTDVPTDDAGERWATVDAAVTELPAFVRPGTILALLASPVDSFYGATAEGVSDLDDSPGYRFALYPAADGSLRDLNFGDAEVNGSGWSDPEWTLAEWRGETLPICEGVEEVACRGIDGVWVVGDGTLTADAASLTIAGAGGRHWVAVAGDAWGEWAEPTPLTELDPDIPPPCEGHE